MTEQVADLIFIILENIKRKPLFLRGVYDYAFLTSLRRAAFP